MERWHSKRGKGTLALALAFSISKKYVIVKGVRKGTAKVQAVIGKKKYTCKVKVSAKKKPSPMKSPQKTTPPGRMVSPSGNASGTLQETRNLEATSPFAGDGSRAPKETQSPITTEVPGFCFGWDFFRPAGSGMHMCG